MVARRALVLVGGRMQQLPTGDSLEGGGSGGGPVVGVDVVDFGASPVASASSTIPLTGVTPTSVIQLFPVLDTTGNNTIDDHRIAAASLQLSALPGTDEFTIEAHALFGLATGLFNVGYAIS